MNFLSEGGRCVAESKLTRMGHTSTYFPFGAISSVTQMPPYHKNYSVQILAKLIIVLVAFCMVVNEAYS